MARETKGPGCIVFEFLNICHSKWMSKYKELLLGEKGPNLLGKAKTVFLIIKNMIFWDQPNVKEHNIFI